MNDFSECLEYSFGERENFDVALLKNHFPWIKEVIKTDTETDKAGIDYIVISKDGSRFTVDAKTRRPGSSKFWKYGVPELCLEKYSVCEQRKLGWLLKQSKTHPDYILYTFSKTDTSKYYLVPFQMLKKAVFTYGKRWKEKYGVTEQPNNGYTSNAMFVPAPVVLDAIKTIMEGDTK